MKKIYALLGAALLTGSVSYSQTFVNENFNAGIPAAWTINDLGAATGDSWLGDNASTLDGTPLARVDSDANGNGVEMIEELETPAFDASAATSVILTFDQYIRVLNGSTDSAMVQVFDGTTWINVAIFSANTTGSLGAWGTPDQQSIDITAYKNAAMKVRFHYNDGNNWAWYWGVDNVLIANPLANDVGVVTVSSSASAACLSTAETVSIDIKNFGTQSQSNFDVSYSVNGTTVATETFAGPLAAGATMTYTFTATSDFSTAGTYTLSGTTVLATDQDNTNDAGNTMVNSVIITSFPYTENFDSNADLTTITFANGWTGSSSASYDWVTYSVGTPSTGTGPAGTSSGTGEYIYAEASSPAAAGDVASLMSPCLDLSGQFTTAEVSFIYHKFGPTNGNMYIDAYANGVWVTLDSILGETQTSDTAAWLPRTIDLSSVSGGTISLRFRAVRGSSWDSDMAIDDVVVSITSFTNVSDVFSDSFTIYPNPNNGTFSIASGEVNDKVLVNIFDVQGRIVYSSQEQIVPGSVKTISLGSVEKGIYLVNIVSSTGKYTQTIIVE